MWLTVMRRYLTMIVAGNLAWESAQLPLYTVWNKAPPSALLYTILHCTLGDLLIATGALGLSVAIAGRGWPAAVRSYVAVAAFAVALGLGYTVYSEWLNVAVRQSWAYSQWMPRVPPLGTGLAPLLQWIVIPALAFWFAGGRRISRAVARSPQLPPGGI